MQQLLKGQEIVSNRKDVIKRLNQALAAEALAGYLYLFYSKAVSGRGSHELSEVLTEMAASEQTHTAEIMERIVQLGGEPLASPSQWEKESFHKYTPPKVDASAKDVVEQAIHLEREAIGFYQELAKQTQNSDFVTFQLVSRLLADEVDDEHKLTNLQ